MFSAAGKLHKLVKRGLLIPSEDFDVEKLPDGRHKVHLRKKVLTVFTGACCTGEDSCSTVTEEDCLAAGGTFMGLGTLCDPNPCLIPGACCVDGAVCSTLSAAACAAIGGFFLGDLTSCSPNPCTACTTATLVCDTVSASKSKCGFPQFDAADCVNPSFTGPIKFYLYQHDHFDSYDVSHNLVCFSDYISYYDPDASCAVTNIPTGSCGGQIGKYTCVCADNPAPCLQPGVACNSPTVTATTYTCNTEPAPEPVHLTAELSEEYTTDLLHDKAVDALPPYDDDFNDSCSASRDLSDDESSLTIQRFRYKFTFTAAPADCLLCWVERFTPDEGDVVDTLVCESVSTGQTETTVREVLEPDTDGEITIVYPAP
jgi:hypothetical protein